MSTTTPGSTPLTSPQPCNMPWRMKSCWGWFWTMVMMLCAALTVHMVTVLMTTLLGQPQSSKTWWWDICMKVRLEKRDFFFRFIFKYPMPFWPFTVLRGYNSVMVEALIWSGCTHHAGLHWPCLILPKTERNIAAAEAVARNMSYSKWELFYLWWMDYLSLFFTCQKWCTLKCTHCFCLFSFWLTGNTRSLKHLCRLRIREHLSRLRLRAPVFVNFLPLPPRLKDYLRFKEFDVYSKGSMVNLWRRQSLRCYWYQDVW